MHVNIGVSIPEYNLRLSEDREDYLYKRVKFNLGLADKYYLSGFRHIRFNNLMGAMRVDECLDLFRNSVRLQSLKEYFTHIPYTISVHLPYRFKGYDKVELASTCTYINALSAIYDILGVNTVYIITHVFTHPSKSKFYGNYLLRHLSKSALSKLVLENDDKGFNLVQTCDVADLCNVGFVYDNLHDRLNPCNVSKSVKSQRLKNNWLTQNRVPIAHLSSGDRYSHNSNISLDSLIDLSKLYTKSFNLVIFELEIKHCKEVIEEFKYRNLDKLKWSDGYSFEIK